MAEHDDVVAALSGVDLACTVCETAVDRGYLPRDEEGPATDQVVCETCGWGDVGHAGCAPELRDFDGGIALLRVERGDDGYAVEVTDE